ncbi:hypothetical protein [Paenibacillus sp. LHD-38]|uniref:hypothetical protein n=1 Tax=Paenibacillus sp. LHD-38 TaxID=3072143 RepID=UPI00280E7608|nr:hypothetical protein [Paenibacillus sp. LHD-38]MDQ8738683.1 hypothetical protein [Paenibacillus sp. LHD-38]
MVKTFIDPTILEKGRAEGKIEGKIETILETLEEKGSVHQTLREKIQSVNDLDKLNHWSRFARRAKSVDEFETLIDKN